MLIILFLLLSIHPALAQKQGRPCPPGWENNPEKHPECFSNEPLPVTVISFQGENAGASVLLSWKVAMEVNHSHYEIERSPDVLNWKKLGNTKGYSFKDYNPEPENYYRLVSVDIDGARHSHKIIFIKASVKQQQFEAFDLYGKSVGVFKSRKDLPRNRMLIVNGLKVFIN